MDIYGDASTLIALGSIAELGLLSAFDGDPVVPGPVLVEVTTEPARTNVDRFCDRDHVPVKPESSLRGMDQALEVLGEEEPTGDSSIVGEVLTETGADEAVGVVSDDLRVRRVARGLGATVTGTIGVVVRNVEANRLTGDEAKDVVRRVDGHGLHMTGELRERADDLIDDAAG